MAKKNNFDSDFLWGASVSTHQVEGGNHNQWSVWELENAQHQANSAKDRYGHLEVWPEIKDEASKPENYVSGKSADHYHLYKTDFDLVEKLNLNALRSGVEWSRIEPIKGQFDKKALAHYRSYFKELESRGITPIVTLWHWTFPEWFAAEGGFTKRKNVKYFLGFVQFVITEIGYSFKYVITINEPTVYTTMSYYEKRWPPQSGSGVASLRVLLNLAHAHKKSYQMIKKLMPSAEVGVAHNCSYFYADSPSLVTRVFIKLAHKLGNEFFINRVQKTQDFLGLNYYFANRFVGTKIDNSGFKKNDLGWAMQPDKLGPLIVQLFDKYKKPIIITESGAADRADVYRQWWIEESIKSLQYAQDHGAIVDGYIHWSLLDNFEWAEGFWPRFGLIKVDYDSGRRTIRASARWYARYIAGARSMNE